MVQETMVKRVQLAIRVFVLVLFLGWVLIWIMMPTNTFTQKWWPRYMAKTNSAYFGTKGAILLMYTFPVMLMATLGCLYVHLAKKINDSNVQRNNGKKQKVSIWKRAVLIKGPLGIVSGTELGLLLMFIQCHLLSTPSTMDRLVVSVEDLILPISGTPSNISDMELQIEAYITRSYGIVTRYYVYPIDHNADQIFSFTLNAFLNMLVICVSIACVASAAFLWNKKHNAKEAKQVQNMEGSTPTVSPNSMVYNVDRELESLPYQSLIHATNVHYGVRPDLRKILFEHKVSSVGVLASGPKIMRQEVAAICSSGLVENIHFESISFSW
ncbi:hypothetical protein Fmac_010446 [Flemingia macrophylla]|uniref:Uncharacterized protein n=1 Tax=Flemingia macrophylla TaxID=520843 RepID=A0ABD1MJL0_9FABA